MTRLRSALRELPDAVFLDLLESDDAYRFVVDLPGAASEAVDLRARSGRITVDVQRSLPADREFRYVEQGRDTDVDLDLPLPPDATAEGATASLERGVLEVTLPKRSEVGGTTIEVEDA